MAEVSARGNTSGQSLAVGALVYLAITVAIVYWNISTGEYQDPPAPLFDWMSQLPVSGFIGSSVWIFPLVQAVHLVVLALLIGSLLVVDLRLLGFGFSQQPLARVARDAQPWLIAALVGMFVTGLPQLLQNAVKEYYSPYFWIKMEFLLAAVIFTFTLRRKMTLDADRIGAPTRLVALVSIALWLIVAVNGRLIGLLS